MLTELAGARGQRKMGSETHGDSNDISSAETQSGGGLIRVGDRPPGDELEERQFITDPCFHPVGGDELGGAQFNSGKLTAESGKLAPESGERTAESGMVEIFSPSGRQIAPTLAEEVLPELPKIPPLIRRRGPRVLTPETVEEFCRLLSVGLSRRQAAARLDIDPTTVSKAAKEDPELAALLQRAEDVAAGDPLLCLIAASRKSWRAAVRLMEHRKSSYEPRVIVDKEADLRERLEDKRLELEYRFQTDALEDQFRDKEAARQEAKKEAAEAAWQERERLMIAKEEREERAERKKRRLEREAAQQGERSGNQ
ncbi:MAG: hypothetical protein ACKVP0_12980 [Pirellulaceae bacterium]